MSPRGAAPNGPPPASGPSPVRAFVLRFVLAFVVLEALVLLVLQHGPWFAPYAEWNARLTAALLGPLLDDARAVGGSLVAPSFSISIRPGCDAYEASAVLVAGIVAFPAPLGRKWIGALVGVACLLAVNLLRLAALLWTGVHHPDLFEAMHLEILPIGIVAVSLGLLVGWALWARS